MKKLVTAILSLMFLGTVALAQNTTVSATVEDSDSTVWANATWTLSFQVNTSYPNPASYTIGGVPLTSTVINQTGTANGSGVLSFTTYQSGAISPAGSSFNLTICPQARVACTVFNFQTIGSSQDISSAVNAFIPPPRFAAVSGAYGYVDVEAVLTTPIAATYWNVTSTTQRCYTGSAWGACNSGSTSVTWAGDLLGSTNSTQKVVGINTVPLCTGYTPTNGQALEYTTGSSPNPCYTAATLSGSGLTYTSPTVGSIPKVSNATSPGTVVNSACDDGATTVGAVTCAEPVTSTGAITGTSGVFGTPSTAAKAALPSGAHGTACDETSTAGVPATGVDYIRCDSTTHSNVISKNGGSEYPATQTICSGTVSLGTSAISSGLAATTVTATCTGLTTTDNIVLDFNGSPLAVTGYIPSSTGMLTILKWPSSNTVNVSVINNTSGSITPGAVTLNYRVIR